MRKFKSNVMTLAPQAEVSENVQAYRAAYNILFAKPNRPRRTVEHSLSIDSEWLQYLGEPTNSEHATPVDYWQVCGYLRSI